MHSYRYKHGDQPLDGYTIHRAAGRGGFGEVYYALSDSGREVALKVIQGYEAIELRGVSQCMNLKSPHLVAIFDVKKNQDGVPFVIMEYVGGPSLRAIIDDAPGGLGTQKSAFFLREMAKGLTYLHDCGIVHRDLKPGNVFFENGYVKIGDYGLSKAMSASQHSGQTVTVGTVHYMAPEIGVGRYDRSIDIYALGAVLYEMLTGQPPYLGASPGEILMKHMSATPDVTGIEEPFASVIRKAMAKDPAQRYQTVQEMVEAVFGAEHVRNSVSVFRPDSLTMVAGKVAQHVGGGGVALGSSGPGGFSPQQTPPPSDIWAAASELMGRAGNRLGQFGNRAADLGAGVLSYEPRRKRGWWAAEPANALDPIPRLHRWILAGLTMLVLSFASGLASGASDPAAAFFFCAFASIGSLVGLRLAQRVFLHRLRRESWVLQHLAVGGTAGLCAFIPALIIVANVGGRFEDQLFATLGAVAITFFVLDWTQALAPDREQRVSLWYAGAAAVCGLILAGMFGGSPPLAIGVLAAASLASQVASPFAPPSARRKARARAEQTVDAVQAASDEVERAAVQSPPRRPHANVRPPAPSGPTPSLGSPVPLFARWIWLGGVALFLSLGVILILAPAVGRFSDGEDGMFLGFGFGTLYLGVTCLVRSFTGVLHGWWGYLIKPLVRWLCVQSIALAFFMLTVGGADNDEAIAALFFLVFPAVGMLLLVFTPGNAPAAADAAAEAPGHSADAAVSPVPQMASSFRTMISSPGEVVSSATRFVLATTGYCALVGAIVVGVIAATDLPGYAAAGLIDWRVQRDIESGPGAGLLRTIAFIVTYAGIFLATAMIVISRKRSGPLHMVRGFLACMGFLAAINMLDNSLHGDWRQIFKNIPGAEAELAPPVQPVRRDRVEVEAPSATQTGVARVEASSPRPVPPAAERRSVRTAAIEQYLDDTYSGMAVWSAVFSCMCLVVLLWTPRRPQLASPAQNLTTANPEARQWLTL